MKLKHLMLAAFALATLMLMPAVSQLTRLFANPPPVLPWSRQHRGLFDHDHQQWPRHADGYGR